jgi:hypothetical protein
MAKKMKTVKSGDDQAVFPKKWMDKLPTGWSDGANSMKEDELKKVIVECEGNLYTIDQAKNADEKLNGAKELARELGSSYRESRNAQQAKIQYALFLLEGRGMDLDHTDTTD